MIYEGKEGSLTFFYNDKLVCSSPLHYKTSLEDHYNQAYRLLVEGMEQGRDLSSMIQIFTLGLTALANQKRYNLTRDDEKYMTMCFLILIKLKILDFDDVALVMPMKKKKKQKKIK
jgi:hypothetical protein